MSGQAPSARLLALRDLAASGSVSLGEITDRLGPAALGTLLLLCGVSGLIPGLAVVLGLPLCLLGLGLLFGQQSAWLPGGFRTRRLPGDRVVRAVDRILPKLRWLEERVRPRLPWATGDTVRRLAGLAAFICGVLIVLPVPFGNTAPAIAVILLAVGLLTRDGLMMLAGFGAAVAALAIDVTMLVVGYQALAWATGWFD